MAETKVVNERHYISKRHGGGQLRREVWIDDDGQVTRYNLAYVNHALYQGDNGRVVGYDNHHGVHHRHFLGVVSTVKFESFAGIEALFERDWLWAKALK